MSPAPLTPRSARVKEARRLTQRASRVASRLFLVEGPQAVREAFSVPNCVTEVFGSAAGVDRHRDIVELAAAVGLEILLCDDEAVGSLAGSRSPQGIVAVCRFVDVPLREALRSTARLVAIGAHLRDPGNAGSLLRCADAVGADAAVLAGSSVDPYNDKAVRASVGSIFHLPLVTSTTVAQVVSNLTAAGFTILAADANAETSLDDLLRGDRLAGKVAWMFGNEAWGIPEDELRLADQVVAVPIYGRAESLNVATAAAVCLYATARAQRSHK